MQKSCSFPIKLIQTPLYLYKCVSLSLTYLLSIYFPLSTPDLPVSTYALLHASALNTLLIGMHVSQLALRTFPLGTQELFSVELNCTVVHLLTAVTAACRVAAEPETAVFAFRLVEILVDGREVEGLGGGRQGGRRQGSRRLRQRRWEGRGL